jgi:hypothetical protein
MTDIFDINYDLESLEDIDINIKLKGFILNYESKNYMITLHSYYPIKKIILNDTILEKNDNILESSWNELLIIKNIFDDSEYKKIKKIKTALPYINQELYCNNDKLTVIDYSYNNINHIPLYPRLLYIVVFSNETHCKGMPVFQKNKKLIGIISNKYNGKTYIIPSLYIIKTLQKNCNDKIYTINIDDIKKINKFNVVNNMIYHNLLTINIPLDVYLTLEGDKNKIVTINKTDEFEFTELKNNTISNERYLLKEDDNYIVNASLLITLKVINNCIIGDFMCFIRSNLSNKILLNISNDDILNLPKNNSIKKQIEFNDKLYYFIMFV